MDSGNGSESGGVHFEAVHGVSFGSGALLVIMILGPCLLYLRCKKEKDVSLKSDGAYWALGWLVVGISITHDR